MTRLNLEVLDQHNELIFQADHFSSKNPHWSLQIVPKNFPILINVYDTSKQLKYQAQIDSSQVYFIASEVDEIDKFDFQACLLEFEGRGLYTIQEYQTQLADLAQNSDDLAKLKSTICATAKQIDKRDLSEQYLNMLQVRNRLVRARQQVFQTQNQIKKLIQGQQSYQPSVFRGLEIIQFSETCGQALRHTQTLINESNDLKKILSGQQLVAQQLQRAHWRKYSERAKRAQDSLKSLALQEKLLNVRQVKMTSIIWAVFINKEILEGFHFITDANSYLENDQQLATALGYTCLIIQSIADIFKIKLTSKIVFQGSRSAVEHDGMRYPLYATGKGDARKMQYAAKLLIFNLTQVLKLFQDQDFSPEYGLSLLLENLKPSLNFDIQQNMGCCVGQGDGRFDKSHALAALELAQNKEKQNEYFHFSSKSIEIIEYVNEILQDPSWQKLYSNEFMIIYYIPSSKYAENCPTTRIQVNLGISVEPRKVFDALLKFDQRKTWDSSIKKIDLEEPQDGFLYAYIQIKMPLLFSDRDLYEQHEFLDKGNELTEAFYSLDYPQQQKLERAWTAFGYTQISQRDEGTIITSIAQTDLKLPIDANKTIKLGVGQMKGWGTKLRGYINSHQFFANYKMKGQIIQAPRFGKFSNESTAEAISSQPFLFSINTQDNEDMTSTQSSSISQLPRQLKPVKIPKSFKKHKVSFTNVLQRIGVNERNILNRNPIKNNRGRSPETSFTDGKGLPFQRRARSASPPRESLKVFQRKDYLKFPANSPVMAPRCLQPYGNLEWKDLKGLQEEDDDLKAIKEEYCKLLEQAASNTDQEGSQDSEEYWEEMLKGEGLDSLSKYFMRGF